MEICYFIIVFIVFNLLCIVSITMQKLQNNKITLLDCLGACLFFGFVSFFWPVILGVLLLLGIALLIAKGYSSLADAIVDVIRNIQNNLTKNE